MCDRQDILSKFELAVVLFRCAFCARRGAVLNVVLGQFVEIDGKMCSFEIVFSYGCKKNCLKFKKNLRSVIKIISYTYCTNDSKMKESDKNLLIIVENAMNKFLTR